MGQRVGDGVRAARQDGLGCPLGEEDLGKGRERMAGEGRGWEVDIAAFLCENPHEKLQGPEVARASKGNGLLWRPAASWEHRT